MEYYGQTVGWINMSLSTEACPRCVVLDEDQAPPRKGPQ